MSELVAFEPKINDLILDTLHKKGCVVGLKEGKILKLVYLLNLKDGDYDDIRKIWVPDLNAEVVEAFDEALKLAPEPLISDMAIYIIMGLSYGLMFGRLFKNMLLGMLLGIIAAIVYALLVSTIRKHQ